MAETTPSLLLRPVRSADLDDLYDLSLSTGGGLTTLPPDRDVLARKIAASEASFAGEREEPQEPYFLFAAEDAGSGRVVGTSGIFAAVGLRLPFYSYRLLKLTQVAAEPPLKVDTHLLQLVNDFAGATELGTLFLHPDWRAGGNGALLSKARYLMMAAFPDRFADKVMAEIRGWVDETGCSPFWEAVGRHFFAMDFAEADRINGMGNQQFIADLMPKFPIYANLLPQSARDVIGRPHDKARGAVRLLEEEGFRFAGAVDIFDAGPCYEAPRGAIRSLRAARRLKARLAEPEPETAIDCMVGNLHAGDMRILRTPLSGDLPGAAVIGDAAARALDIADGEAIVAAPLNSKDLSLWLTDRI